MPDGLTVATGSCRRKAWLAVFGVVGFLLAALTGWFAYRAVTLLRDSVSGGSGWFPSAAAGVVAAFPALFLGKALFFVCQSSNDRRIEITADGEPQLPATNDAHARESVPDGTTVSPRSRGWRAAS